MIICRMGAPDLSTPIPHSQSRTFGHVRHDRNRVIMPYLATWLTVSKDDKRAISTAAAHAERAAAFLHGLQPQAAAPELPDAGERGRLDGPYTR